MSFNILGSSLAEDLCWRDPASFPIYMLKIHHSVWDTSSCLGEMFRPGPGASSWTQFGGADCYLCSVSRWGPLQKRSRSLLLRARVSTRVRPPQFSKLTSSQREGRIHFGTPSPEWAAWLSTSPPDCTRDERGFVFLSEPASVPHLHVWLLRDLESALSLRARLLTPKTRRRQDPAEERQLLKSGGNYFQSHFWYFPAHLWAWSLALWPPSWRVCSGCFSCFQIWDVTVSLCPTASFWNTRVHRTTCSPVNKQNTDTLHPLHSRSSVKLGKELLAFLCFLHRLRWSYTTDGAFLGAVKVKVSSRVVMMLLGAGNHSPSAEKGS